MKKKEKVVKTAEVQNVKKNSAKIIMDCFEVMVEDVGFGIRPWKRLGGGRMGLSITSK